VKLNLIRTDLLRQDGGTPRYGDRLTDSLGEVVGQDHLIFPEDRWAQSPHGRLPP
jgi:hypothetical protein